jgi:hypothetical protein
MAEPGLSLAVVALRYRFEHNSSSCFTTIFFAGLTNYNNVQFSYRSALIPDTLQGRANSVFRLIAFSGPPLGMALTGLLLQGVSVLPTLLVFSACFVVLAIGATWSSHIRSAGKHNQLG